MQAGRLAEWGREGIPDLINVLDVCLCAFITNHATNGLRRVKERELFKQIKSNSPIEQTLLSRVHVILMRLLSATCNSVLATPYEYLFSIRSIFPMCTFILDFPKELSFQFIRFEKGSINN